MSPSEPKGLYRAVCCTLYKFYVVGRAFSAIIVVVWVFVAVALYDSVCVYVCVCG